MSLTLNYEDWDKMSHEKYALTIKDILTLKPGDQIKVLSMDRNVWDIALEDEIQGKSCKPKEFFSENYAIYIHEENLKGKLVFAFELKDDTDYIDNNYFVKNKICQPNFEFHIEYKHHCWYPLHDGYMPASDPQGFSKFPWTDAKHWSAFPQETRIGWRGHFVLWSKLDEMPNIIWPYPKEVLQAFDDENDRTNKRTFKMVTDNELINSFLSQTELNIFSKLKNDKENEKVDFILQSIYESDTSKSAARQFSWRVKDKVQINNMQLPITFNVDVIETTEKSNQQTYKYGITCEADHPRIDGRQRLGNIIITKI